MNAELHPDTNTRLQGRTLFLARAVWGTLVILALVLFFASLPAGFNAYLQEYFKLEPYLSQLGLSVRFCAIYFISLDAIQVLAFAITGIVIFWRKSNDGAVILFSLICFSFGMIFVVTLIRLEETQPTWGLLVGFVRSLGLAGSLVILYLFPNGRFIPAWTRWLTLAWTTLILIWLLFPTTPFNLIHLKTWFRDFSLSFPFYLGWYATGLYAQIYRFSRVSGPIQRQQTKWAVFGFAVTIVGFGTFYLLRASFPSLSTPGMPFLFYRFLGVLAYNLSGLLTLVCLGISILRYRLWAIDFLINRSLVYGALTLGLVILFGGSLGLVSLGVRGQVFPLAFGVTALIAGATFNPARRRLQRFVDQQFYQIYIEYHKTRPLIPVQVTQVLKQTHFGAYQHLELIGRGGMAEVYKSTHPTLNVPVAIKLLPPQLATEQDFRQRFTREAHVVSKLKHPNIVRIFDYGEQDDTHYMVMEYLTGKDLGEFLHTRGKLTLAEALPIIQQIAAALDYAHLQGLVHRDIKPSNIMLDFVIPNPPTSAPRAILTDFGIAKLIGQTAMTRTGGMLGTFDYIAPEQIQASANVDGRADVYALGVMIYQMLTGELPFKHNHPGALLIAHMTQPAPDPREVAPELSSDSAYALQRALAKDPAERYPTAGGLALALA